MLKRSAQLLINVIEPCNELWAAAANATEYKYVLEEVPKRGKGYNVKTDGENIQNGWVPDKIKIIDYD